MSKFLECSKCGFDEFHIYTDGDYVCRMCSEFRTKAVEPAQAVPVAWLRKNGFRFVGEIEPQDDSEIPLYTAPPAIDGTIKNLIEEFPVYDDKGLSETEHCCEWVMLQERKRLHAILKKLEAGNGQ